MKKIVFITLVIFIALQSCKKEDTTVCGVDNPATELPWLAEIIALAETDTTGNYYGAIYLESYKGEDVIWVDMFMGSGGNGHWFNCDGSHFEVAAGEEFPWPTKKRIIYTNE